MKEALDTYGDDEAPVDGNPPIGGGHSRRQSAAELGDGFSLYSGSDSDNSGAIYEKSEKGPMLGSIRGMDDGGFRQSGKSNRSGRLGSEFGTNMSRGTSIGKETYMEDDALLNEDEDEGETLRYSYRVWHPMTKCVTFATAGCSVWRRVTGERVGGYKFWAQSYQAQPVNDCWISSAHSSVFAPRACCQFLSAWSALNTE